MKTSRWYIIYWILFVLRACVDWLFLCGETVSVSLHNCNKSMTLCLIKERDRSLKQHQAMYKIFRWHRGRQWSKNRAERELEEALQEEPRAMWGQERDASHSATFLCVAVYLNWACRCCLTRLCFPFLTFLRSTIPFSLSLLNILPSLSITLASIRHLSFPWVMLAQIWLSSLVLGVITH